MPNEQKDDWLFPQAAEQKVAQEQKGLVFAQKYLVFSGPTADPRARELLEHWTRVVRQQTISPGASAQEYAYFNARREFIELIWTQIEFANNGLNQPRTRNPHV